MATAWDVAGDDHHDDGVRIIPSLKRKAQQQLHPAPPRQPAHYGAFQGVDEREYQDLRLVLVSIVKSIAETCVEDGAQEMIPETHGYPLSKIKDDFKGTV
jgi:hypothetical protein